MRHPLVSAGASRGWLWLAVLFGLASPAGAQAPVHIEVTPQIGYFFFNGDEVREVAVNEDAPLYQMRFGLVFPGNWGLEGSAGLVVSDFGEGALRRTARSYFVGGAGTYRFANPSRVTPFVSLGVEMLDMDTSAGGDQANVALVWGGGVQMELSPHAALRLDGRHHYYAVDAADPDLWLSHFEIAAGLAWRPWE